MTKQLQRLSKDVEDLLTRQIETMMLTEGRTRSAAAIVAAQFVIAPALAYTAAAMGKKMPEKQHIKDIVGKILDAVGELPDA